MFVYVYVLLPPLTFFKAAKSIDPATKSRLSGMYPFNTPAQIFAGVRTRYRQAYDPDVIIVTRLAPRRSIWIPRFTCEATQGLMTPHEAY